MSLPPSTTRPVQSGVSSRVAGLKFMQRAAARQSQSQSQPSSPQPSSTPASPAIASSSPAPQSEATAHPFEEWVLPSAATAIAQAREAHSQGRASARIEYDDQWRSWELDDQDENVPAPSGEGQVGRTQFGAKPVKKKQRGSDDDTLEPDLSDSDDEEEEGEEELGVHLASDSEEGEDERKPAPPRKAPKHEDKPRFRKPQVPSSLGAARAREGSGPGGKPASKDQKRSSDSFDAPTARQKRSKQ